MIPRITLNNIFSVTVPTESSKMRTFVVNILEIGWLTNENLPVGVEIYESLRRENSKNYSEKIDIQQQKCFPGGINNSDRNVRIFFLDIGLLHNIFLSTAWKQFTSCA